MQEDAPSGTYTIFFVHGMQNESDGELQAKFDQDIAVTQVIINNMGECLPDDTPSAGQIRTIHHTQACDVPDCKKFNYFIDHNLPIKIAWEGVKDGSCAITTEIQTDTSSEIRSWGKFYPLVQEDDLTKGTAGKKEALFGMPYYVFDPPDEATAEMAGVNYSDFVDIDTPIITGYLEMTDSNGAKHQSDSFQIFMRYGTQPPDTLHVHQQADTALCGTIPQYLGYSDDMDWWYTNFHFSPVTDVFAVGGSAYKDNEQHALVLTYYGKAATPNQDRKPNQVSIFKESPGIWNVNFIGVKAISIQEGYNTVGVLHATDSFGSEINKLYMFRINPRRGRLSVFWVSNDVEVDYPPDNLNSWLSCSHMSKYCVYMPNIKDTNNVGIYVVKHDMVN